MVAKFIGGDPASIVVGMLDEMARDEARAKVAAEMKRICDRDFRQELIGLLMPRGLLRSSIPYHERVPRNGFDLIMWVGDVSKTGPSGMLMLQRIFIAGIYGAWRRELLDTAEAGCTGVPPHVPIGRNRLLERYGVGPYWPWS